MTGWSILLFLSVWSLAGLVFWLGLVAMRLDFLPSGPGQVRVRRPGPIPRAPGDRRRRARPGSVDRRQPHVAY